MSDHREYQHITLPQTNVLRAYVVPGGDERHFSAVVVDAMSSAVLARAHGRNHAELGEFVAWFSAQAALAQKGQKFSNWQVIVDFDDVARHPIKKAEPVGDPNPHGIYFNDTWGLLSVNAPRGSTVNFTFWERNCSSTTLGAWTFEALGYQTPQLHVSLVDSSTSSVAQQSANATLALRGGGTGGTSRHCADQALSVTGLPNVQPSEDHTITCADESQQSSSNYTVNLQITIPTGQAPGQYKVQYELYSSAYGANSPNLKAGECDWLAFRTNATINVT
jgi:hypothetical protein